MKTPPKIIGRICYVITYPGIMLMLWGSKRAYVAVVCGDEMLVVKGWLGNQKWHLPGGGLKKSESYQLGAARELLEETGVKITPHQLTPLHKSQERYPNFSYQIFSVLLNKHSPAIVCQPGEIIDAQFVKISWLRSNPQLTDDRTREALLKLV